MAVVVVVPPGGALRVRIVRGNWANRYAREGAVAVVAIEIIKRRSKVAHEQVQVAIVVVISPGAAGGIPALGHDWSVGDGRELRTSLRRSQLAHRDSGNEAKEAAQIGVHVRR